MKTLENTHTQFMFAPQSAEATQISEHENPLCDVLITQIFALDVPVDRNARSFVRH